MQRRNAPTGPRAALATLIVIAGLMLSATVALSLPARATAGRDVTSYVSTYPVTLIGSSITRTVTTTARFNGDATWLDIYSTIVAGSGSITVTYQHSSNGADWVSGGQLFTVTTAANQFTRTAAYGGYYRFIVNADTTITPTLRVVQKP